MAQTTMPFRALTSFKQRERSRSPRRRSRSPRRRRSYTPRSRSRSPRGDYRRDRSPMSGSGGGGGGYSGYSRGPPRSGEDRAAAKQQMMQSLRDTSQQDRRVYVGNLSYDVKWHHLKDFMRQAGEVIFADVLLLPNGMSKGCGIVEYNDREEAQNAIATLSNQNLMGRLVYVREDRETEPRFANAPPGEGGRGGYGSSAGGGGRGGYGSDRGGPSAYGGGGGGAGAARQLYVSNLPYEIGWQDLKDLFRQAAVSGNILRADVHQGMDGRPKGSGIVVFELVDDARNAINQFNGYDWHGRVLEVREDRYPQSSFGMRGDRGGFGGRGGMSRGGFQGGRGGHGGGGYGGPPGAGYDNPPPGPNPFTDFATAGGERSEVIYVRNLPWSTSNEDLIELFQTIGKVEQAEIQYEPNGRSKGTGVVRFDSNDNAETAIQKFSGYQYGGRPLGLSYVKYLNGDGGDEAEMRDQGHDDLPTQDQIM